MMTAWLVLGALVVGVGSGVAFEHNRMSSNIEEERTALLEKIRFQEEALRAMGDQIVSAYSADRTRVEVKYRTITKEAINVAQNNPSLDSCRPPDDWVRVYNSALSQSEGSRGASHSTSTTK